MSNCCAASYYELGYECYLRETDCYDVANTDDWYLNDNVTLGPAGECKYYHVLFYVPSNFLIKYNILVHQHKVNHLSTSHITFSVRLVKALISVTTKYVKAFNVCAFAEVYVSLRIIVCLGFAPLEFQPIIDIWLEEKDLDCMYSNRSLARGE
jgi:hypothetical protein